MAFVSLSGKFDTAFWRKDILNQCSFWVFLVHPFYITEVKMVLIMLSSIQSPLVVVILHFLCLMLSVVIAVLLYYMMHMMCPKVLDMLLGSRR